jgi:hypothetical protein
MTARDETPERDGKKATTMRTIGTMERGKERETCMAQMARINERGGRGLSIESNWYSCHIEVEIVNF